MTHTEWRHWLCGMSWFTRNLRRNTATVMARHRVPAGSLRP